MSKVNKITTSVETITKELEHLLKSINQLDISNYSIVMEREYPFERNFGDVLFGFRKWNQRLKSLTSQENNGKISDCNTKDNYINRLIENIRFNNMLTLEDSLLIASISRENCQLFPDSNEWTLFIGSIQENGLSFLSDFLSNNINIFDENQKIRLIFNSPLRIIIKEEIINDRKKYTYAEAKEIVVSLDYEWYFNQNEEIPTMVNVIGKIIGYK